MAIDDYTKTINFQDIPEKDSADMTDCWLIQDINEQNAKIKLSDVKFPLSQIIFGPDITKTTENLQQVKAILDKLNELINTSDPNDIEILLQTNYGSMVDGLLGQIKTIKTEILAKMDSLDLLNGTQLQVLGTDPSVYFDSGWKDITSIPVEFIHTLNSVPKYVCVQYKLKNNWYGWTQGTIFYNNIPFSVCTVGDDHGGIYFHTTTKMPRNVNQTQSKINVVLPTARDLKKVLCYQQPYELGTVWSKQYNLTQEESALELTAYKNFQCRVLQYKNN